MSRETIDFSKTYFFDSIKLGNSEVETTENAPLNTVANDIEILVDISGAVLESRQERVIHL